MPTSPEQVWARDSQGGTLSISLVRLRCVCSLDQELIESGTAGRNESSIHLCQEVTALGTRMSRARLGTWGVTSPLLTSRSFISHSFPCGISQSPLPCPALIVKSGLCRVLLTIAAAAHRRPSWPRESGRLGLGSCSSALRATQAWRSSPALWTYSMNSIVFCC